MTEASSRVSKPPSIASPGSRPVNDQAESNGFVAKLDELSVRFDCPVIAVIHLMSAAE